MSRNFPKRFALFSAALLATINANAADLVWIGGTGNWDLAANWSPTQVPGPADNVFITGDGTYTVILDKPDVDPAVIGSLTLGGASGIQTLSVGNVVLTVNGASVVNANGQIDLTLNSSELVGTGSLTVDGALNWTNGTISGPGMTSIGAGGVMNISGNATLLTRTLINGGAVNWSAGNLDIDSGAAITNLAGGTITIGFDGTASTGGTGGGVLHNTGTLFKTAGAASARLILPVNNAGTVEVQSGTLSFDGGGTHPGTFTIAGGTVAQFGGGNHVLTAESVVTGAGLLRLSGGGTLDASGTFDVTGSILNVTAGVATLAAGCNVTGTTLSIGGGALNFNSAGTVAAVSLTAGTLGGTSPVTVTGPLTLGGGTITNALVTANGGLTINGNTTLSGGKLINPTNALWSAGNFTGGNGAVFSNLFGATFVTTFDGNLATTGAGAPPTFVNAGIFQKTGGTAPLGKTAIDFLFINTGVVEVQTNTLRYSTNRQTDGLTLLNGGGLDAQDQPLQFLGGTLMGTGLVTMANTDYLTNSATVSPGLPLGELSIVGNYLQTASGVLDIELGGYSPGTNFDRVTVTGGGGGGVATLGGTLNVTLANGFSPTNGATFTFLTAVSRAGAFATFQYPSNDIGMQVSYDLTTAKVTVSNLKPVVVNPIVDPAAGTYGTAFDFQFPANTFSDPDNDPLTYTAKGLPPGITFDGATRTFAGTPAQTGIFAVTVTANDPGNLKATNAFTITINPAPVTIVANAKSKTYGEINPTLDAVVTGQVPGGDAVNFTLTTTATELSSVGNYPITVTLGSNPNYSVSTTNASLTVSAALAGVVANAKSKTYGEINPTLDAVVTGQVSGGDVIDYTLATTASELSSVGSYPITVTLGSNPNYSVSTTNASLTVNAALASVVANAKSRTYGETNPVLDAVVTGQVSGGDVIDYTLATTASELSSVGSYPITVTLGSNPNYSVSTTNASLTVNTALASVVANAKSKTYGEINPTLDAVVTGQVPGGDVINYTLATTASELSGVGSYPITVTLGSNPNYSVSTTNASLTVNAATASVVANPTNKIYGETNPVLDAVVTGQVPGGDVVNYTLATTASELSSVGSYPITVTLGSNPNYSVSATNASLTVSAAVASVVANAKNKTYGETNPVLDAVVTGQVPGGDAVNYTLATTAIELSGVGSYPITVTLGSNPNYSVSATNGSLTVNAAVASVVANAKSRTYGETNPVLDAVVTGQVPGGDAINFTLATTATALSSVGSYPITVTLGSNPNYSISTTNGSLTVNAAVASVVANAKSKTYGETNPVLDAVVTGQVPGGDAIDYTLATTASELSSVGSYPITVTLGSNPNYSVSTTNGTLTIAQAPLLVTADDKTKTYDEADPAFTVSYAGFVNGESAAVLGGALTFTRAPGESVGSYSITPGGLTSANYAIAFLPGTLTITAPAPRLLSLIPANQSSIVITWSAVSNAVYRLQFKPDLAATNWTDLGGDVAASGSTASKTDTLTAGTRFYRVQVVP